MQTLSQDQDLTGKNRRTYNVIIGWLGQLVFVASGFILPRMINTNLGMETLGIWDFAWTLITYFEFIYGGMTSSVNRYVSRYRALGDIDSINTVVNSAFVVLVFFASLIALLSASFFLLLPIFFQERLGPQTTDAQWVILFLGLGLAIKIGLAVFGGVLTGCHRWDLHHGINTANRLITLLGMVVVLVLGGGLPVLALVYFLLETLVYASRCSLVHRICPGLKINPYLASKNMMINMWRFGLKTLLPDIGDLLSNQTFNLFLVWFLGPAALASYARPRALVRHIQTFVRRYAFTLTPTASSLQAMSADQEICKLFITSCQTGSYIVFPMIAVLTIMGGPILQFWMGSDYADNILPLILALGYLPLLLQLPLNSLLQGFNTHGWPGLFKFIAAVAGIGSAFLALSVFHASIATAAVALFVPFWISEFIATPLFAAKKHEFSLKEYWFTGVLQPLLVVGPMVLCLLVLRLSFPTHVLWPLLAGVPFSLLFFAVSYWFYGISPEKRNKFSPYFRLSKYLKKQSQQVQ